MVYTARFRFRSNFIFHLQYMPPLVKIFHHHHQHIFVATQMTHIYFLLRPKKPSCCFRPSNDVTVGWHKIFFQLSHLNPEIILFSPSNTNISIIENILGPSSANIKPTARNLEVIKKQTKKSQSYFIQIGTISRIEPMF